MTSRASGCRSSFPFTLCCRLERRGWLAPQRICSFGASEETEDLPRCPPTDAISCQAMTKASLFVLHRARDAGETSVLWALSLTWILIWILMWILMDLAVDLAGDHDLNRDDDADEWDVTSLPGNIPL